MTSPGLETTILKLLDISNGQLHKLFLPIAYYKQVINYFFFQTGQNFFSLFHKREIGLI